MSTIQENIENRIKNFKWKKISVILLLILLLGAILLFQNSKNSPVFEQNVVIGNVNFYLLQHSSAESTAAIILSDQHIGEIPFASEEQLKSSKGFNIKKFGNIQDNKQVVLTGSFDEVEVNSPVFKEDEILQYFNAKDYKKTEFYKLSLEPTELLKYLNGEKANFHLLLNNPTNKEINLSILLWHSTTSKTNTSLILKGNEKKELFIQLSTNIPDVHYGQFELLITSYTQGERDFSKIKFPAVSVNDYRIRISNALNKGDTALVDDYSYDDLLLLERALDDPAQQNKDILLEGYSRLTKKYFLHKAKYTEFYPNGELNSHVSITTCLTPNRFDINNCNKKITETGPTNTFYLILGVYNWGYTTAFDQKFNFTNMSDISIEKIEVFNADTKTYQEIDKNSIFNILPLRNSKLQYASVTIKDIAYKQNYITIALRLKAKQTGTNKLEFYFGNQKISLDVGIRSPIQNP